MARALLVLAAALLAVPAVFAGARGLAVLRRRSVVIQGRPVNGARALGAALVLLGWAAGMLLFAALVLLAQLRR